MENPRVPKGKTSEPEATSHFTAIVQDFERATAQRFPNLGAKLCPKVDKGLKSGINRGSMGFYWTHYPLVN